MWSVGKEYQLLARQHTCYCSACAVKDFDHCDMKVGVTRPLLLTLLSVLQEYVDRPELVKFYPVQRLLLPNLRRKQAEPVQVEYLAGLETEDADVEESVTCDIGIQIGKFYAVLGDSLEGYYIVKCASTQDSTFSGKYLMLYDTLPSNLVFKETKNRDTFYKNSVLAEVSVVHDFAKSMTQFLVSKVAMDDILLTVAEMSCI